VDAMTTMFRESGVDARSVSSHTQERVRKDLIQAFKDGEFPVLINCEPVPLVSDMAGVSMDTYIQQARS
jgi:ATP-dependent helicase IRC3